MTLRARLNHERPAGARGQILRPPRVFFLLRESVRSGLGRRRIRPEGRGQIVRDGFGFISHERRATPDHLIDRASPAFTGLALRDDAFEIVALYAGMKD